MRGKMLIYLALLCLMLAGAGWMAHEAQLQTEEYNRLQQEIHTLEQENTYLRKMVQELRAQQETLGRRMQKWLDEWDAGEFEATAYTLECGNGDGYTATMTRPEEGRTVAVDPDIVPLGSPLYVKGLGWRLAEDTGGLINGHTIDLYMGAGSSALNKASRWGRKNIIVVYPGGETCERHKSRR